MSYHVTFLHYWSFRKRKRAVLSDNSGSEPESPKKEENENKDDGDDSEKDLVSK